MFMPSEKGAIVSLFERLSEWEQAGDMSPVAKHHAQSLLIDFIRLQTQVSQRLAKSTSFMEIATALAKDIVASGQFFSVNLFNLDSNGDIEGLTCVAVANRREGYEADFFMDIPATKLGDLYKPIFEDGVPVYIADTQERPDLRVQFMDKTIESYIIFPMRSGGRTIGIINLNSVRGPLEPTPFELEWYFSLVQLATSQVELNNLITEKTSSHDLSERQAQVFNQLLAGQELGDMAQIIAHYLLPQKGRSLAMMELVYSGTKISHWVVRAVANRNRLLEWDIERELRWQDLGEKVQAGVIDGETFIIDDSDLMTTDTLGVRFAEWLNVQGVKSAFSVPISNGRIPIGVMVVMSRQKRAFSRDEINAFQNISELVGALTEVRLLTEKANESQRIINELLMANRLIATAQTIGYMGQGVMYTLGKRFSGVIIALFDAPIRDGSSPKAHLAVAYSTSLKTVDMPIAEAIPIPSASAIQHMLSGLPYIHEEELPPTIQLPLGLSDIVWTASFGLRVGDELIGTLSVIADSEYILSEEEISAYTSIADQIGLTIRGRQLLQETQTAQQFAQRLVQANQAISIADDYATMGRLLIDLLPDEITCLSLLFFDKAERVIMAGDMPAFSTLRVVATHQEVFTPDLVDDLTTVERPQELKDLVNHLLQGGSSSVPDLRPPYQPLIKNAIQFYLQKGIYSTFNLGLRVGSRLLGVMSLGKQVGYEISELQRNNLFAIADQLALTIENRRLLNEAKVTAESLSTQVRALRVINDLSSTLITLQTEQAVMDKTLRALVDAINIDHAGITLLTEFSDIATVVSEYPNFGAVGLTFSARDDEFQRRLRQQPDPIVVNHIATSTNISPQTRETLMKVNVKSIAILPLVDTRVGFIGSVGLDIYDEHREFTPMMIDFARTITAQMAVTLQNIRLLQNTRRQARQMEAIAGFSQALQAVLDVPSLLKIALEDVQQILSVDMATVILFDPQHQVWHRVAYSEGSAVQVNMTDLTPVNEENTTAGQVIKSQRMFSANDLTKTNYRFTFDETIQNSISLPLSVRGACVGVVEIGSRKINTYTNTDSAIFQQLVSQIGIGIENAETYSQSQTLARTKAMVNDIASQLQKQTEIDQILKVTLNEVGKAIGAKRARIRLMTGDEN
ncbi:MAG: hypothetical protein CUN52_04335 [Phototrophicales bacterium]|nr:MAG: hypothetical protein CUN52_04335 [Phototrophicales bacterium]